MLDGATSAEDGPCWVKGGGPVVRRVGPAGIVRRPGLWPREWAMSGHARAMRAN